MNDTTDVVPALLTGALLGGFFFGGLWWTVERGVKSARPAAWFLGSMLLRTGTVLFGFYFVSQGHWSTLVACLLGFLMARVFVMKWLTRGPFETRAKREEEISHAP
jgi:F1F0 ATPase subunit 2